jgi:hypothetical protein
MSIACASGRSTCRASRSASKSNTGHWSRTSSHCTSPWCRRSYSTVRRSQSESHGRESHAPVGSLADQLWRRCSTQWSSSRTNRTHPYRTHVT